MQRAAYALRDWAAPLGLLRLLPRHLVLLLSVRLIQAVAPLAATPRLGGGSRKALILQLQVLARPPGAAGRRHRHQHASGDADCAPYRAYQWMMERVGGVEPMKDPQQVPSRLIYGIVLAKVSFGYPDSAREVLRQVDLNLPAGSVVALVGTHGSGKTTLVELLTQMHAPTAGRITLDGHDLGRFEPEEWRSRITCAFHDFLKYKTTLGETVGIGDLPHREDDERISRALVHAGAGGLAAKFADGLATPLGNLLRGRRTDVAGAVAENRARPGMHARGAGTDDLRRAHRLRGRPQQA